MSKTVMCVDDEINLLKLYQQVLTEEGYQVLSARTIKEAMELLEFIPDRLGCPGHQDGKREWAGLA